FPLIKGRAMFVWLSFKTGGGLHLRRVFHNVMGAPSLPRSQVTPPLQSGIDACRSRRPSATLPPPPNAAP
ncbi:MAG TPA: hypothetical protein PLU22_22310, partial [Polyangiaceae bacterium]|nr:hypothetical protein [Polyangiaceae bacterium]